MNSRKLGVAAVAAVLIACGSEFSADLRREIRTVATRTTPDGLIMEPYPRRTDGTVEASWTITLRQPWADYERWVTRSLGPDYSRKAGANMELVFSRTLPGDAYSLTIHQVGASDVEATFVARPF